MEPRTEGVGHLKIHGPYGESVVPAGYPIAATRSSLIMYLPINSAASLNRSLCGSDSDRGAERHHREAEMITQGLWARTDTNNTQYFSRERGQSQPLEPFTLYPEDSSESFKGIRKASDQISTVGRAL